jgi:hypothetical protein
MKLIIILIFVILVNISCKKYRGNNNITDSALNNEINYIYNFVTEKKYNFGIPYNDNNVFILKTWSYRNDLRFTTDIQGREHFIFTNSYWRNINNQYDVKNVLVAHSKEDLEFIESNYINSKYLQEIPSVFFENNILILVSFMYGGATFPKNSKIINNNGEFAYLVEIWENIPITEQEHGIATSVNMVLKIFNIIK